MLITYLFNLFIVLPNKIKQALVLSFIGSCFSLNANAVDVKVYYLKHTDWEDVVTARDLKFCKKAGSCGTIEVVSKNKINIIWDTKKREEFSFDLERKQWVLDVNLDSLIQDEYEQFVYTFEEPYIKINPYGRTPLSALIKFPTDEETQISIRIKAKENGQDIIHHFKEFKKEHEIPLLGLYPNYDNKIVLEAKNKKNEKKVVHLTVPVSDILWHEQWFVVNKNDNKFHYYATYDGSVYDEYGNLRYLFKSNGWVQHYFYKDSVFVEYKNGINQYSILGKKLKSYQYPEGFYGYMHGMGFKDNGNIIIFGTIDGNTALIDGEAKETNRDIVLEFDAKTGKVIEKYDLAEMLNPDRSLIIKSADLEYSKVDWTHTNGVDYDAKNKAIILSGRHIGIIKIDEKSKKPIWWLTPHQLTHKSGRNGDKGDISHLLLTAVDKNKKPYSKKVQKGIEKADGFKWPLKTHNVKYIGNGLYSILDNSGEMYDKSLYTTKNSVASVFKIDDKAKTVQQLFLKELSDYSDMGSVVIVHPKTQEYWVFSSHVSSFNSKEVYNGVMRRFDKKGKEVYKAIIHKDSNGWIYLIQPYQFYSDENWLTPHD